MSVSTTTAIQSGRNAILKPVIAYHLEPANRDLFASHWSQPSVIDRAAHPAWLPPAEATAIFTFISAWWKAPSQPPAGWPFGIRWLQLASAGADALPGWAYDRTTVTCSRGITAAPIAEYVFNVLLDREKRLSQVHVASRMDALHFRNEALWRDIPLGSLKGKNLGIVGLGAIGREIAGRAIAFGMKVSAIRRSDKPSSLDFVKLRDNIHALVADCDHLILCAPATAETRNLIDESVLDRAKPGIHLVNVARGQLIDHAALSRALASGKVGFATLDVTDPEPLPEGHEFYRHPNVRLTPHVAWYSPDHHDRLTAKIIQNLDHFARGEPLDEVVDPNTGY